jgi:hypothetical protein
MFTLKTLSRQPATATVATAATPVATVAVSQVATVSHEALSAVRCVVCCESCRNFSVRPGTIPDGWCRQFNVETWARVPFSCGAFLS